MGGRKPKVSMKNGTKFRNFEQKSWFLGGNVKIVFKCLVFLMLISTDFKEEKTKKLKSICFIFE